MGLGRRLSWVLFVAGSVLLVGGVAAASTAPDVERDASASTTTVAGVPTSAGATTTVVETTSPTSPASTTTTPSSMSTTATSSITTTTTPSSTTTASTTSSSSTTTTSVPAAGVGEQLPTFWLRGLCATPRSFIFAMSNLGTAPVQVDLVFNGQPFDTVTLAAGEVYGFRTEAPGTMVANLPGASFQTESFDAPCPVAPGSIGMGGLCRDAATGYQWLIGNSGPDPVDVEVRLEGTVVGTFTVESGGFAGFTTPNGGQAQALVGGQVVAEAQSSGNPCVQGPASLFPQCFAPGQGYRWFVSNDQPSPVTLEFRVGGVPQAVLTLAPFEGREVTTAVGGLGELLLEGEVVASALSEDVSCDSQIELFSLCADTVSGTWWDLTNLAMSVTDVRLVLDGVEIDVVTLQPGETRQVSTTGPGTMQAYVGGVLMARADSSLDSCVAIFAVCVDTTDGQVWALEASRPASLVDVTIGGVPAGTFDLSQGGLQFASPLPGTAEVSIGGTVVDSAEPSTEPCVGLFAECHDAANGYVFVLFNRREEPRTVELRIGPETRTYVLEPFGGVGFALPTPGPIEVFIDGQLVQTVEGSETECEAPAVSLTGTCFADEFGGYQWDLSSQRPFDMTVDLRLNGQSTPGPVSLAPFDFRTVSNRQPGVMAAFVNDVLVAEAPSADAPCLGPPTTDAPRLPGTGRRAAVPVSLGLACLAAGLLLLAAGRKRDDGVIGRF